MLSPFLPYVVIPIAAELVDLVISLGRNSGTTLVCSIILGGVSSSSIVASNALAYAETLDVNNIDVPRSTGCILASHS